MIDVSTGILTITDTLTASPLAAIDNFIDFFKISHAERWDVRNGWLHYYIKNLKIQERYFIFDFMFYKSVLNRIDFCYYDTPVIKGDWNDWSEEIELKKQKEYQE